MKAAGGVWKRGRVWWIYYNHRGRQIRESSDSHQRRDAVNLLKKRLGEMGQGRLVGPQVEKTTFAELAALVTTDYEAHERASGDRLSRSLRHLRAFFGDEARAVEITADRLDAYLVHRKAEGAKLATIKNELAALRRGFRLGMRVRKIAEVPIFPTITPNNRREGFFEADELADVLANLPDALRPVATFAYWTGWRKGEILGLRWSQVDRTAGVIRIEKTKNREARTIPYHALPVLVDVIERQRQRTTAVEQAEGRIIPFVFHRQGKPIRDFRGAWRKACDVAGVPHRIPHDFRRTAARNMVRVGIPQPVAMQIGGWKTDSVFRRYAIVDEKLIAEALGKLAQADLSQATEGAQARRYTLPKGE